MASVFLLASLSNQTEVPTPKRKTITSHPWLFVQGGEPVFVVSRHQKEHHRFFWFTLLFSTKENTSHPLFVFQGSFRMSPGSFVFCRQAVFCCEAASLSREASGRWPTWQARTGNRSQCEAPSDRRREVSVGHIGK